MNLQLSVGIFALYVGIVSLVGLMGDREAPTVIAAKRYWGRKRGLTLHFIANIALPLVFGIVFLSRGAIGFGSVESSWGLVVTPLPASSQEASLPSRCDLVICGDATGEGPLHLSRGGPHPQGLISNPLLCGFPLSP